jgi:hypothetical protein
MKSSQFFALIALMYLAPHINTYVAVVAAIVFGVLAVLLECAGK